MDPRKGPGAPLTISEQVRERIRADIVSGELRPGQRLLLSELAESLGVSNIPVRDALRELEKDQLVQKRPLVGYEVSNYDGPRLIELYSVREALECQIARLCAKRGDPEGVRELERLAEEADRSIRASGVEKVSYDQVREFRFHRRLAQLAACAELATLLDRVYTLLGTFIWPRARRVGVHVAIVRAIATGDPDQAERAMRDHVALSDDEIESLRRFGSGDDKS
ncbi:MAG: GntR family transcriptional regulator [Planctomycetota bacterium]